MKYNGGEEEGYREKGREGMGRGERLREGGRKKRTQESEEGNGKR